MTIIATIRQDRTTALIHTDVPAEYFELPSWAVGQETQELPGTIEEVMQALEPEYAIEYLGSWWNKDDAEYGRYRLTPYPIGADGHPVRSED